MALPLTSRGRPMSLACRTKRMLSLAILGAENGPRCGGQDGGRGVPTVFGSGGTTVVPQEAAQSLAAPDRTLNLTDSPFRDNQAVFQPLVISFGVIMFNELPHRLTELVLAEEDDLVQAFGFDGSYESLGQSVQVGTLRWQFDRIHAARLEDLGKGLGEERVSIVDQIAFAQT